MDIEGQQLWIIDGLGRRIASYAYDLLSNRIFQASADAGDRWTLPEVAARPLRGWDSRGYAFRYGYDALRRQTHLFVRWTTARTNSRSRSIYGEGALNDFRRNLRSKIFQRLDAAGVATNSDFDFKGNLLRSSRQLLRDYRDEVDWNASPELEDPVFENTTTYDALNRPVSATAQTRVGFESTTIRASLLDRVDVNLRGAECATPFVTEVTYNAKAQRELIAFGNGARTRYAYDPLTFRLTHLKTVRHKGHAKLQDLNYTYDPIGNITSIADDAQQTVYFDNQVVSPSNDYVYDATLSPDRGAGTRAHRPRCGAAHQSTGTIRRA